MTHKVSLEPSGHHFQCDPGEPILDASLRAGLSPNYGCSNGSCGDCRARLLSGNLHTLRASDYTFSELEKSQNWFLPCINTPDSDISIEAQETSDPRDLPTQTIEAKVTKVEELGNADKDNGDGVRVLHLRTPRSQTLRFLAGQRLKLQFPGVPAGEFAIASCPCNGMQLQIHVCRKVDEGDSDACTDYVFESLRNGQQVTITGPIGDFTFDDEQQDRPQLLVAYRAGFAAVKSLMEHAIGLDVESPIRLLWLAYDGGGHYLENQCRAWADALDDFQFTDLSLGTREGAVCSRQNTPVVRMQTLIQQWDPQGFDTAAAQAYVSGPKALAEAVRETLKPVNLRHGRV